MEDPARSPGNTDSIDSRTQHANGEPSLPGEGAAARALVSALADAAHRGDAFRALLALESAARPAIREGLGDGRWEVRRWCAVWLSRFAEAEDAPFLLPLLHDPKSKVRHSAVVALSQQRALHTVDVIPRLIERALSDDSPRVRRAATLLLAWEHPHPDLEGFFAALAADEGDEKLRRFARLGIRRCRERATSGERGQPSC